MERALSQLVDALCDGDDNAYHTLLELEHEVVPELMQQFANATDGERRARIIEVIWQHRLPTTIPFLASALGDSHPEVWQQALDGLVTIGGEEARDALKDCLDRFSVDEVRSMWITEALGQIRV